MARGTARSAIHVVTACLLLAPRSPAAAQDVRRGTIDGVVRRATDSVPLAAVEVTLDSAGHTATSDFHGEFRLSDVTVGMHVLRAHRLGYRPDTVVVSVSAASQIKISLQLYPTAQLMPEVEVQGHSVLDLPRFTAAVKRASRNNGAVFTAADIARENPLETRMLLERLPGVHVNDRGITFARCQDSGMLPTPGNGAGAGSSFSPSYGATPRVQVYVDGLQITRDQGGQDANDVLKSVNPRSIAVMDVYTGIARIPGEYAEVACAVVAIWTKSY